MAQIRTTIKIEMDNSKQSWMNMVATKGMRKRTLIAVFLGLFTQLSGNSLLTYYSNLLFEMIGYTTGYAKTRINLANQCWNLIVAVPFALFIVARFKRRVMFLLAATGMLIVFMSMTISFEQLNAAKLAHRTNHAASISALFWYFAYTVPYNLGNNALTYSEFSPPSL